MVVGIATAAGLGACTQDAAAPPARSTTIVVGTVPSLEPALSELAAVFEDENPGVEVRLDVGLTTQSAPGLPERTDVHLFASANRGAITPLVRDGTLTDPVPIARNHVVLAVPAGNPGGVRSLRDLQREDLRVALCAEDVPCGEATAEWLASVGVTPAVDARLPESRSLAAALGDAEQDVGIILRTDVAASRGWVTGVEVDERERALAEAAGQTEYVLARVPAATEDGHDDEAEQDAVDGFRALVTSERGRRAFDAAGLRPAG